MLVTGLGGLIDEFYESSRIDYEDYDFYMLPPRFMDAYDGYTLKSELDVEIYRLLGFLN